MSFTIKIEDKAEKITIHLHLDKTDNKKIKVKLDQENQKKFDKLKDKSSLGKNCLLGGKNVVEAVQDKEFTKHESYKTATLSTLLKQISISHIFDSLKNSFNQVWKSVLGGSCFKSLTKNQGNDLLQRKFTIIAYLVCFNFLNILGDYSAVAA